MEWCHQIKNGGGGGCKWGQCDIFWGGQSWEEYLQAKIKLFTFHQNELTSKKRFFVDLFFGGGGAATEHTFLQQISFTAIRTSSQAKKQRVFFLGGGVWGEEGASSLNTHIPSNSFNKSVSLPLWIFNYPNCT